MNPWVAVVILLGFMVAYFWWIVAIVAPAALAWLGYRLWQQHRVTSDAATAGRVTLAARADEQHAQVLADNEHGTYGEYPPAV